MKSSVLVAGFAALSLAACSTVNPYTNETQFSKTGTGAIVGTGGGAVLGAIVGTATGTDPRVAALLGAGIGGIAGVAIGSYMDQQEAELRAQLQGTGVSVTRVGQQIILNMPSNITFGVDSATVQPTFNETLISVGLVLKKFNKTIVDVYGHTDDTGSAAHNQELSAARARSVLGALVGLGVEPSRLQSKGYGQDKPLADNATEAGRALNRRVELVRR